MRPESDLEVRLLGPVEVLGPDGTAVALAGPKQRGVLALLALTPNEAVSVDQLIEGVWDAADPDSARRSLQVYVSNLRRALGSEVIETRPSGYALSLEPDRIDHRRFRRLVREASGAGDPRARLGRLEEALALVRGAPLADIRDLPFADATGAGLEQEVLGATERQLELRLELGEDRQLIRELEELVASHPLREGLRGQLMLAYYRAGRQAEALRTYDEARRRLAEELGIDPSPQLRDLHERILQQDQGLRNRSSSDRVSAPTEVPPTSEVSARDLVGREQEVTALVGLLEESAAGRPQVVLLGGEAGIGKSRLLSHIVDLATEQHLGVLSGHCIDLGDSALPFAPLAQALRRFIRQSGPQEVEHAIGPVRSEVERIVPELGADRSSVSEAAEPETRRRLFAAVLDVLERISSERPVLLAVEDIHWADPSTLDLLDYLARSLTTERLFVIATFRTDELHRRHALRRPLAELGRVGRVRRIDLSPFSPSDIAAQLERILGAPPDPDLATAVAERSGGNPFYVEELVAASREQGGGTTTSLPPALHDVVAGRIEQLPDESRRVLAVAAVAGERVEHGLLEAVDRLADVDLDAALRPAVEHHVLVTDAEGYRFRHALVREVVYDDLLPGERTALHRALASALAEHPELATGGADTVDTELAHHWYVAHERRLALDASLRAADGANAAAAYAEAARHYERALELWGDRDEQSEGRSRHAILEAAADCAYLAGDPRRAVALMEEVIADPERDQDPTREGLRHERLGRYHAAYGDLDAAVAARQRAVELVPGDPPSSARAQVLATYAGVLWTLEPQRARALSEEAIRIARDVGDRSVEASALIQFGASLAPAGDLDASVERLREALAIAEERRAPHEIGQVYEALGAVLVRGGRASEGADVSLEGLARVRELGVERLHGPHLAGNATSGLFWAGRWDEAGALMSELGDRTSGIHWLLLLQGRLQAYRGELELARATLERAGRAGAHSDPRYPAIAITLELFAGDLEAAHREVLSALERDGRAHAASVNQLQAVSIQAEADRLDARVTDDVAGVRKLADRLLDATTDVLSGGLGHAEPWRLTALAEHGRLADEPATDAWRQALAAWEELDWPYQVAYANYRLGEALLAGDPPDPPSPLRRAAEIAEELGAQPLLADISRVVERSGGRLPRPLTR